ncbi:hypothetical protein BV22DRAFT_1026694, partial [Leucogyrophana mollusca]
LKSVFARGQSLRAIDFKSETKVIIVVDTSHIAVGFYPCQCDLVNPKRYFVCFGSITLNNRESWFLQPKLELYCKGCALTYLFI